MAAATPRMSATARRLHAEARDLLELVLLPGLVLVLPWRLAFACFRWLARRTRIYADPVERAHAAAAAAGLGGVDAAAWRAERRLVTLVDHADCYLARTRSERWLRRHVAVTGQWGCVGQAALLITFHWGCGMWAHRQARASGLHPHMLLARAEGPGYVRRWVLQRYAGARARQVGRCAGRDVIFVPGAMAGVHAALAAGEQVVVVLDVPPGQVRDTASHVVLGRPMRLPAALLRLAVEMAVPVTVFTLGLDPATGERDLRLYPFGVAEDANELAERVFAHLDGILRERPAAWHMWPAAGAFWAPEQGAGPKLAEDAPAVD